MKRTPLRRKTPLRSKSRLRRKKRIKPVNRERKKKRYEKNSGDYADVIRDLPCCICHAPPPSDPHHVKSRGAGGTKRDLVPTCRRCHRLGHLRGWESFEKRNGVNLRIVADELWKEYGDCD